MNANELADEVEMWGEDLLALNMRGGIPVIEGAKMLRQQQAEIEALKAEATKLVMAEHCTCYKLGYSPLNDYAAVKQK
jgi:hypothetical protein